MRNPDKDAPNTSAHLHPLWTQCEIPWSDRTYLQGRGGMMRDKFTMTESPSAATKIRTINSLLVQGDAPEKCRTFPKRPVPPNNDEVGPFCKDRINAQQSATSKAIQRIPPCLHGNNSWVSCLYRSTNILISLQVSPPASDYRVSV
mmetsp:Transcript_31468/g.72405  ORF Transcript_31468/g.72405 Transcript_31468/m.72405 type:complete len:146 (+) Transcript_31468:283-720(+)